MTPFSIVVFVTAVLSIQVIQTISQPKRYRFDSFRPQPELESIPPQLSRRISLQSSNSYSPLLVTKSPPKVRSLPETIPPQVSRRLSQSSVFKSSTSAENLSSSTNTKSTSDSFSLFKLPLRLISNVLLPLIPPKIRQNTTSIISPLMNFQMPLTLTTNHLPCNTNISPIPCNSVHYSTKNLPVPYNSHIFGITNNSPHDSLPCGSNNSPIPCNFQSGITNNTPVPCNPIPGIINNCSTGCSSLPCSMENSSISLNQSGITNNTSPVSSNHHDVSETIINLPYPCSHLKSGNNFYNLLCNCITLLNKVHNFSCTSHVVEDSSTKSPIDPDLFSNETDNTSKPAPSNTTPLIDVQPTDNTITEETQTFNTTIDGPSLDNSTPANKELPPTTTTPYDCYSTASDSPTVDKPILPCLLKHNHKIIKPYLPPIHTQKPIHFKPHSSIYRISAIHPYSQIPSKFHPPNHASCSSPLTYIHSLFKPSTYKSNDISLNSQNELILKMLQSLMSTSDLSSSSTDR